MLYVECGKEILKYTLRKLNDGESLPEKLNEVKICGKSRIDFPDEYVVLDIETTGLNAKFNEIIELSALRIKNGTVEDEFNSLVRPKGSISSYITQLTGITREMTLGAPDIKDAIKDFNEFCSGHIILGHNVRFDINFINNNLQKHYNIPFNNDYIDSLRIARILLPQLKNRKLSTIAEHFGFNTQGMHRGLKDCQVTNLCFCKFKELAIEKFGSLDKICK